jgi:hypothetical protein
MRNYFHRSISVISLFIFTHSFCQAQLKWCANENGRVYFEAKTDVAYGAGNNLVYKNGITGWISFDNATFGDPAPGVTKNGFYIATNSNAVWLYYDPNFTGASDPIILGDVPDLRDAWSKKISSVTVPDGYKMIAYETVNFQGASIEIIGKWTSNNETMQWNDRIASYRITKVSANQRPPLVRIYEHANFEGSYFDTELTEMSTLGDKWNKQISSIKIDEGFKMIAYEGTNFQGASIEITGDWTLAPENMQWNDRISSYRIEKLPLKPTSTGPRIRIYQDSNFDGPYQDFAIGDLATLGTQWDKQISSISVPEGYKMYAFERPNFRGPSIEIIGNQTLYDWNNRISSFKIVVAPKPVVVNTDNNSNNNSNNNNNNQNNTSNNNPNNNSNNTNQNNNPTNNQNNNNSSDNTKLPPDVYVRVFENPDFTGASKDFKSADAILGLGDLDNKVSAMLVKDGYKVVVYDRNNLEGDYQQFAIVWTGLTTAAWDNRISSFLIMDKNKVFRPADFAKPLNFANKKTSMTTIYHRKNFGTMVYSIEDSSFKLANGFSHQLKMESVGANRYRILIPVNGKYWALGSSANGFPKIQELANSSYQYWQFELLDNASYKIRNIGLFENNSRWQFLYCAPTTNKLFIDRWIQDSTSNAEWNFSAESSNQGDLPDPFDKKTLSLIAVSTNQAMGFLATLVGGDVGGPTIIAPAPNNKDPKASFIKTINGDYFIKLTSTYSTSSYYINDRGQPASALEKMDPIHPNPKFTWKISSTGNGTYTIINTTTNKAMELTRYGTTSRVNMNAPSNSLSQQWYLRQ